MRGVFATPQFAVAIRPFPIAGEGRLRFGRDAIEINGFTVARSAKDLKLLGIVTVVVFVCVIGLVLLDEFLESRSGSMPIWVWAAILGGAIGYLAKSGHFTMGEANAGDPVSFKLPWRCVANVEIDVKDNVVIDLRQCKPKGRITFLPDEDPDLVLDVLQRGIESARPGR